jgi:hypothetical protein
MIVVSLVSFGRGLHARVRLHFKPASIPKEMLAALDNKPDRVA